MWMRPIELILLDLINQLCFRSENTSVDDKPVKKPISPIVVKEKIVIKPSSDEEVNLSIFSEF